MNPDLAMGDELLKKTGTGNLSVAAVKGINRCGNEFMYRVWRVKHLVLSCHARGAAAVDDQSLQSYCLQ